MRKRPYTAIGIKRMKCCRCGGKGYSQWNVCADNGAFRPLCRDCDIELNSLVLNWARDPEAKNKIAKYRASL